MRTQHTVATAWRRWLFRAFPALAALALTMAMAHPASAADGVIHTQNYISIIKQVSNPCNGGPAFLLTGVDHMVLEVTINQDGVFQFINHQNAQLSGFDDLGNTYIGNLTDTSTFNGQAGVEATRSFSLPIIGHGGAPNFNVHFTLHVTVNADGTVTAQVAEVTTTCQG